MQSRSLALGAFIVASLAVGQVAVASHGPFMSLVEVHAAVEGDGFPHMVISADGRHVYMLFTTADAIGAYERDALTGSLSLIAGYRNGLGGFTDLASPLSGVLAPDGGHLYVVGDGSHSIAIMARDAVTGALTFSLALVEGDPALGSLGRPRAIVLSPDGAYLYATDDDVLATFSRDAGTGALTLLDVQPLGASGDDIIRNLIMSPDGSHIYSVGRSSDVDVWTRDLVTGLPTLEQETGLAYSTYEAALSPDGAYLYLLRSDGSDHLAIFARDGATGLLTFVREDPAGFNSFFLFSPDGSHLYGTVYGAVVVCDRDPVTGVVTKTAQIPGLYVSQISPDGMHFYGYDYPGNWDVPGTIEIYDRDAVTGLLTQTGTLPMGIMGGTTSLDDVVGLHVTGDGRHVYAGGRRAIVAFQRDADAGTLTLVDEEIDGQAGVSGLDEVRDIAVSPDGEHLYAIGSAANSVVAFDRDPVTGALTFLEAHVDGQGGVTGLGAPQEIAVSADGANVYVVGSAVAVFDRDPGTGALTFAEAASPGGDGIALSRDDSFVLVATASSCGLAVFARDPAGGTLSAFPFSCTVGDVLNNITVSPDGHHAYASGGNRLRTLRMSDFRQRSELSGGAASMDVAPDGAFVFMAGGLALAAFGRTPASGQLRLLQLDGSVTDPESALRGASRVAVSPDRRHLYVTAKTDDSLSVYALTPCGPFLSRSKLVLTRTGTDPNPSDDRLVIKADFVLGTGDFAALDPVATGLSGHLEDSSGATVADFTLPGGAFGGSGTRGWQANGAGSAWKYADTTGSPIAGVDRVVLKDQSRKAPNLVGMRLKGKNHGYPVDTANLPLAVSLTIGGPDTCALSGFVSGDCVAKNSTNVVCRAQ